MSVLSATERRVLEVLRSGTGYTKRAINQRIGHNVDALVDGLHTKRLVTRSHFHTYGISDRGRKALATAPFE